MNLQNVESVSDEERFDVNVSYEQRWIIYLTGSGVVPVLVLLALKIFKMFQTNGEEREEFQQVQLILEQAPLLPSKDDVLPSWGSSDESLSNEEEDLTMWLALQGILLWKESHQGKGRLAMTSSICMPFALMLKGIASFSHVVIGWHAFHLELVTHYFYI
ncbi:hypothetical protein GLYMA_18G062700v4 [Glycine max]|uniref:Uncharacterized protein n=1 Tax=Glycine max TaxID=3847 RepID=A0A0R0EWX1_SOYBN|nr:hypothetical protein GYH30_049204 [Glycine max]KRG98288.1 hypothetical protein GLYMA_18G062700v4 [Glycine max]